jgi:GTPase SAR1 family protein
MDIRELVNLDDVMDEMKLGPNGGLIYCMEYLIDNISWLEDHINDYSDDYLIIDCPGQIELYTHLPVMRRVIDVLRRLGYSMCAVYMMDSMLISDPSRFLAGSLMCMSVMAQLELPHVSVLSKCDLIADKDKVDDFLEPDAYSLLRSMESESHGHMRPLNEAIAELVEEYSMVAFAPLDISNEDSIEAVLSMIDMAMQYGEDLEPRDDPDAPQE